MGYSWAFSLKITIPEDRLDAFRKGEVGAVKPPPRWGRAHDTARGSVASVLGALAAEEVVEVTWIDRGVTALGVLSNDSSTWADLRTQIAGVVPAARDVGGSGELAVTGWTDGGPADAFVIAQGALARGSSSSRPSRRSSRPPRSSSTRSSTAGRRTRRTSKRVEKCIAKLGGAPTKAGPEGHLIGVSPSARAACRTCKEKIPKGELRFGEAGPNQFSSSGETSHRWYHLRCAAEKKASIFGPVFEAFTGEVPDREVLAAVVAAKTPKAKKKS